MTFDKFTIKAQEAVQEAVNTAQQNGQQSIEPVHLLKGVMVKAKDVAGYIFQKLGANASQIEMVVDSEIKRLPRVQGGQPYLQRRQHGAATRSRLRPEKRRRVYKRRASAPRPSAGELHSKPHLEGCRNDRGRDR